MTRKPPSTRDAVGIAAFQNSMYMVVDKSRIWDDRVSLCRLFSFIKRDVNPFESSKFIDSINDIQGLLLINNKIYNRNS